MPDEETEWNMTPRGARTTLLLVSGLLMLFHETVIANAPRWELIIAALSLIGIETGLRRDGK